MTPALKELGRRVGLGLLAGAVSGFVIGGVGGRLFMLLLARLNPEATGVVSDDGFVMGQFTLSGTLNLLLAGTLLGAVGGVIWVGVRGLRFGPSWWRHVSMPLGATIVIGSMLVHSDGVDFTLLDPPLLAVALTLSVPLLATVLMTALGDRWIGDSRTVWDRLPAAVPWVARGALTILVGITAIQLMAAVRYILL